MLCPRFTIDPLVGWTFKGLLFKGIILTSTGPKVLEYNDRFGDPETHSIMPLLSVETDLVGVMLACISKRLHEIGIKVLPSFACNVVVIAAGCPQLYREGDVVEFGTIPECTQDYTHHC